MALFTIRYQYGTYSGTRDVRAEDGEQAIAQMWARMRRAGELGLPMAYQSAKVVAVREDAERTAPDGALESDGFDGETESEDA